MEEEVTIKAFLSDGEICRVTFDINPLHDKIEQVDMFVNRHMQGIEDWVFE